MQPPLTEPWRLGRLEVPNRVMLAPLAGIGNWFVRLQAKRHGAGMAVSEMVSTHAIHHRNRRTCEQMLHIDPREHAGGPVAIQLFGEDPGLMREGAAAAIAAGADAIDINMGCPVPKVRRTGAGVQLLAEPDRAVALAAGAVQGAGGAPVTVKLRSGLRAGDESGRLLALRLADEAGVAGIAFHPRSASVHHKGTPDYPLAARLAAELPVPVILTGGLADAAHVRAAYEQTGVTAVMLARGALGNPWLFEELLAGREAPVGAREVEAELAWTISSAREAFGSPRADHYLRKFYPWYVQRLGLEGAERRELQRLMQTAEDADAALAALRCASLATA
jgi:nifR3 family TIM-barrel protein